MENKFNVVHIVVMSGILARKIDLDMATTFPTFVPHSLNITCYFN